MKVDYSYVSSPNIEEVVREVSANHRLEQILGFSEYENATIVPAKRFLNCGVVDSQGNSIISGAFNELYKARKIEDSERVERKCDEVIFIGVIHNVWGHCLTDALKKIWFLQTETCKKLLENKARIVYLLPDNEPLKTYAQHFYEIAGLDLSAFEAIKTPTRFKKVIIPDNSLRCELSETKQWRLYYFREYIDVINLIKYKLRAVMKVQTSSIYDKVYLTRTRVGVNDREYGEKSIECIFRKKGFMIISPEKYSLEEQFNILTHCKELATTEGSISHSAIFCNPGTKLYLIRKSNYVNGYQTIINEIADLDVTYIDAHCSLSEVQYGAMYGPFYMCITPELERFVGHRVVHLPLWMRPSWWWYKNHNRKIVRWMARVFKFPYF